MFNVVATITHNPEKPAPFLGDDKLIKSMVMKALPDDLNHVQIDVGGERIRAKLDDLRKAVDGFHTLRSACSGGA